MACFVGFVAINSGIPTAEEILADRGLIHEIAQNLEIGGRAKHFSCTAQGFTRPLQAGLTPCLLCCGRPIIQNLVANVDSPQVVSIVSRLADRRIFRYIILQHKFAPLYLSRLPCLDVDRLDLVERDLVLDPVVALGGAR